MTLIEEIIQGHHDPDLHEIREAIVQRIKYQGQLTALTVRVGTKVRISETITPRGFRGLIGTVVRRANTRTVIAIELTPLQKMRLGRYIRNDNEVNLPAGTFEVIA